MRLAAVATLALVWASAPLGAGEARILLTGTYAPQELTLAEQRTFTLNAEEARIDASYSMQHGFGGELGVEYDFVARFGVRASFSYSRRKGEGRYDASLPHPLYLDRDRSVSGSLDGLQYEEAVGNLDLVLVVGGGPVRVSFLAGLAAFRVDARLLGDVETAEAYPYDTAEVTGTTTRRLRDTPIGYGGAVGVDWRLSRRFGLGAQARYNHARAELASSDEDTIVFDAGGLQVGFGIRFLF